MLHTSLIKVQKHSIYTTFLMFFTVVKVEYELSSYTITEMDGYTRVCVTSTTPGIDETFTTNATFDKRASKYNTILSLFGDNDSFSFVHHQT